MTAPNLDQAMKIGLERQRAGRLSEAETVYRDVLAREPEHRDALHMLGLVAAQTGRLEVAMELIRRSITVDPGNVDAVGDLGNLLQAAGRLDEAIAAHQKALRTNRNSAAGWSNLANALRSAGRIDQAISACQRAIALDPNLAAAHHNLGNALSSRRKSDEAIEAYREAVRLAPGEIRFQWRLADCLEGCGRIDEAIAAYRECLRLEPGLAKLHNDLGVVLQRNGQAQEAITCYSEAVRLDRSLASAWSNLCDALENEGRLDEAIAAGNEAVRLNPRAAAGRINLANALHEKGHFSASIEHYREALRLHPDDVTTLHNLANALQVADCTDESIAAYERAIRLAPKDATIHSDFAVPLQATGKLDEAVETCLRALELDPDYADALNNLGVCYKDRGQLDLAVESLRKAAQLSPDDARYQSNLIYATCLHPDCDGKEILEQCLEWDRRHGAPLKRRIVRHGNDPSPDRRLRIGYLSPDFRNHVVSWNLLPLLREHDREAFEVFCFGDAQRPDFFTEKIRGACDHWRDILGMTDEAVAEAIRADGIDILVDLTLHLTHNRLLVFALKPAPLQVTYLGYCGTTGLEAIDYRFSDPYLDGPGADLACYREKTVRLARTYWCYEPGGPTPEPSPLPALSNGRVTFGCLNIFPKVSTAALDLWLEILRAVPNSRLLLRAPEGFCRTELVSRFGKGGVTADRLEFVGTQPWEPYLETLQRIDVALDPFPYGGGISTCDALWMGIPVVSLIGRTAVGRGGFSILSNISLPELAADSPGKYVEIAIALASDLPRLSALRMSLRERMERSPLRDPQTFARDVEAAYREMWCGWCAE